MGGNNKIAKYTDENFKTSSLEPQGQFHPNLAQIFLGGGKSWGFHKWEPFNSQKGENTFSHLINVALRKCVYTPVSSYDGVTSLCWCSSVSEARKVFVYVNGGTDAAWDA